MRRLAVVLLLFVGTAQAVAARFQCAESSNTEEMGSLQTCRHNRSATATGCPIAGSPASFNRQ